MTPKLPCVSPEKLDKLLQRCGFRLERISGSHHFYHNPQTKRSTVIPFNGKEVPKGLLNEILKEAGISREEVLSADDAFHDAGQSEARWQAFERDQRLHRVLVDLPEPTFSKLEKLARQRRRNVAHIIS